MVKYRAPQPSLFDTGPEAAPPGATGPKGEPPAQPQAFSSSIDGQHPAARGAAGVDAGAPCWAPYVTQPTGAAEKSGIQPVIARSTGSRGFNSRLPPPTTGWREVPQPLFDSWATAMQLAYCARRDEDSAGGADTPEQAAWFLARAAGYRKEMVTCSKT